jgi:hypothetical protein
MGKIEAIQGEQCKKLAGFFYQTFSSQGHH